MPYYGWNPMTRYFPSPRIEAVDFTDPQPLIYNLSITIIHDAMPSCTWMRAIKQFCINTCIRTFTPFLIYGFAATIFIQCTWRNFSIPLIWTWRCHCILTFFCTITIFIIMKCKTIIRIACFFLFVGQIFKNMNVWAFFINNITRDMYLTIIAWSYSPWLNAFLPWITPFVSLGLCASIRIYIILWNYFYHFRKISVLSQT